MSPGSDSRKGGGQRFPHLRTLRAALEVVDFFAGSNLRHAGGVIVMMGAALVGVVVLFAILGLTGAIVIVFGLTEGPLEWLGTAVLWAGLAAGLGASAIVMLRIIRRHPAVAIIAAFSEPDDPLGDAPTATPSAGPSMSQRADRIEGFDPLARIGPTLDPSTVAAHLAADWAFPSVELSPLTGGMNSQTWLVRAGDTRCVAKAVPAARRASFAAGLEVAQIVEAAGIPAGAPLRTVGGQTVVDVAGFALAVLRFVDGSELTGRSIDERALIGSTLGRAHRALLGHDLPSAASFPWLDPAAAHVSVRPWIRPAIEAAMAAWDALDPERLTWAPLHTDPAPEAFRLDRRTGVCGLIDWDLGVVGPLLYDLASAQMYVGGPARSAPLIAAYLATGALEPGEVERGLGTLARIRWAVQADYFAKRIATDDMTGIADREENEGGLEDARLALVG